MQIGNVTETSATARLLNASSVTSWSYQVGTGTCHDKSGTNHQVSLSSLDQGTSYTVSYFSGWGCSLGVLASATFTTLNLTAVPAETTATLTLQNYTGAGWRHKQTSPSEGTCSAKVTGTTANLATLTGGVTYTWKAFEDEDVACLTDIADVVFKTVTLDVSEIAKQTAKLTINDYSGTWYHKYTSPSGGQCSSAVSGRTANLASLNEGVRYTWKAYRDSSCSNLLATRAFTTVSSSKPTITLSASPNYIMESAPSGTAQVYVKLTASSAVTARGCLKYKIVRGTASASDLAATNLNAPYWACIEANQTVGWGLLDHFLYPVNDGTVEGAETLLVQFHSHDGTLDGSLVTNGTLNLHDGRVAFRITGLGASGFYGLPEPGGTSSLVVAAQPSTTLPSFRIPGTPRAYKGHITLTRTGGTATSGADYVPIPDLRMDLLGGAGGGGGNLTVTLKNDTMQEGSETIVFTPSISASPINLVEKRPNGQNLAMGTLQIDLPGTFSVPILDDESAAYSFSLSKSTILEGGGQVSLTATVSRRDGQNFPSQVDGTLVVGTTVDSASSLDYTGPASQGFTLPKDSASASKTFQVTPTSDAIVEGDEHINVVAQFLTDTVVASVLLQDDDTGSLTLSKNEATVTEGSGNTDSYTIQLGAQPAGTVSVSVTSSDTTAVTASPGTLTFTTSNWNTAQTVTVTPVEDADKAGESVTVTNTATGGGYNESATVTVAVTDNDATTLAASDVTETTARLTIGNHSGKWHHKKTGPSAGTCSAEVSGTTADLSNLTGGIAHTWKAYSDASCATEIGTATFSTVSFTATAVTGTTATLNIGNWTNAWWYRGDHEEAVACTMVVANTATASLVSLSVGTSYTYTAYESSICHATGKIADVTFSTLVAVTLTASDITRTTAKLTIANHSGTWYYKSTTPAGNCSSAGTGTSVDLSGLTEDTDHVYKHTATPPALRAPSSRRRASRPPRSTSPPATSPGPRRD